MRMKQQMQRWERFDNRYVVKQGVVLGGGIGIGLLAAWIEGKMAVGLKCIQTNLVGLLKCYQL